MTFKLRQTSVHKYIGPRLERMEKGEIAPSFLITHTLPLDAGAQTDETFKPKRDGCIKVAMKPFQDATDRRDRRPPKRNLNMSRTTHRS